jgi:hypothetical protein
MEEWTMYIGKLLEELEVLEDLRRKAEDAYYANEDDLEIEEAFGEAVNAESAAFHRLCDALVEFTDGRIQSHMALRIVINEDKREALRQIISCI